jgi:hypothetical protein
VRTPSGRGVLRQVFAERVAVIITGKLIFWSPDKIMPVSSAPIGVSSDCMQISG